MQNILCYGDSNTWGASVEGHADGRYPHDVRWTGALQTNLGDDYNIIAEGLGGRTTVTDDPIEGAFRNGRTPFLAILHSHKPLDWVVILLGTNDLKARFNKSAHEIALGAGVLVDDVKREAIANEGKQVKILLICPPPIIEACDTPIAILVGGEAKSKALPAYYQDVATKANVHFLEAGQCIKTSRVDGAHWAASQHKILAGQVAKIIAQN